MILLSDTLDFLVENLVAQYPFEWFIGCYTCSGGGGDEAEFA